MRPDGLTVRSRRRVPSRAMADDDVDRLYGLDLDEFVRERDALAKRLRAAGDRERADEVKRLPKPTVAAWAVNRAVREHPDDVRALVSAGKALARAQKDVLGGANPAELRDAAAEARAAVERLAAAADVRGATAEKVRATLHAATVDPEFRDEVAAGRVLRERAAAGFGGLEGLAAAAPARGGKARGRGQARGADASPADGRAGSGGESGRADASRAAGSGRGGAAARERDDAADARREAAERRRRDVLRRAREAEAAAEGELAAAERALAQVEAALASRQAEADAARRRLSEARRRRERAERQAT